MKLRNRWMAMSSAAALCAVAVLGASGPRVATAEAQPAPAPGGGDACAGLARMNLKDVEIVSATSQPAKAPVDKLTFYGDMMGKPGFGPPVAGLPAFCRVVGRIHPEPGSDIGFEVWMPAEGWDGRLSGVGIGGFAGAIDYLTLGQALKGGQVGVATDTGHTGGMMASSWANGHPERVRDYGWRAIHLSTVAAKKLVASYYGRGPEHSYFIGCSGGGRQGLMEASRFPEDYDGVVAGAPAAVWTELAFAMINAVKAQAPVGAAIRANQAPLLQQEVIRQCDALDGQTDGLIADPRQCKLDLSKLACGTNSSAQCFTPAQIGALRKIYAGPHDRSGRRLAFGYLPGGSEVGKPLPATGWDGYILAGPDGHSGGEVLVAGLLKDVSPKPMPTPAKFDFDKDAPRLKGTLSGDLDAQPDLRRFFARGGKLILWHGWADAAIPPQATLEFYDRILRASGPQARRSVQLFMAPGVQHCMGGTGADSFGQLNAPQPGDTPERSMAAAVQAWVETGRKPETLIARRGMGGLMGQPEPKPERQRLLCAYPGEATLKSGENPDLASSYTCRATAQSTAGASSRAAKES